MSEPTKAAEVSGIVELLEQRLAHEERWRTEVQRENAWLRAWLGPYLRTQRVIYATGDRLAFLPPDGVGEAFHSCDGAIDQALQRLRGIEPPKESQRGY